MMKPTFAVPATAQRKGLHILFEVQINNRMFSFLIPEEQLLTLETKKGERVGKLVLDK